MESFELNKVKHFEQICQQFYETADNAVRCEAEKTLLKLASEPDCLQMCQLIIEHAQSPYALAIAVNTMTRAIEKTNVLATLNVEQRLAMRAFLLRQLSAHLKQSDYVANALAKAFAVLTRVGWFDQVGGVFVHRRVIEDLSESLTMRSSGGESGFIESPSADRVSMMMTVLTQLVVEMSTLSEEDACYSRSIAKYRRVNASFRDLVLLETFKTSTSLLRDAAVNAEQLDLAGDAQQGALVGWGLRLVHACLAYDFIGTLADESTNEEMQTVQVPNTWRSQLVDGELISVIYRLYNVLPDDSNHCATALGVLVQLSAIRRSLFTSAERQRYLNALLSGAVRLLDAPRSLANRENYHAFCRLLARLKSNFQLGELIACDIYSAFARLVGQFTVSSLRAYDTVSPNALFYVLSFWQRVVTSIAYLKSGESHLLDETIREIASTLILTRTDSLTAFVKRRRAAADNEPDDPLEDHPTLFQQLDQLACITRFDFDSIAPPVIQMIDAELTRFETLTNIGLTGRRGPNGERATVGGSSESAAEADSDPLANWSSLDRAEIELVFYRLAWLVYVGGALVGGRISFTCTDEHDQLDAEIACRVLKLASMSDSLLIPVIAFIDSRAVTSGASAAVSRLGNFGCASNLHESYLALVEKLDLAVLFFFEQLRKIYIGEQTQRVAAMYTRLAERAALLDESMLLAVLTEKLLTNLKCWARSEHIVARTVHLLNDLSMAFGVVRKLGKLECVQYLLNNHAQAQLAILAGLPTFASRLRRSGTPHNVSPDTEAGGNYGLAGLNGPAMLGRPFTDADAVRLSANSTCPVHGAKRFMPSTGIMLQLDSLSLGGVDEADAGRKQSAGKAGTNASAGGSSRFGKLNRLALLSGNGTGSHCTCKAHCGASVWKYRRAFYAALGRLLVADSTDEDEEEKLERFMRPFQRKLVDIQNMLQRVQAYRAAMSEQRSPLGSRRRILSGDTAHPRLSFGTSSIDAEAEHERLVAECQVAIAGLALDLRGLLLAFTSRSIYARFFEAVYPNFTDTLVQSIDLWFTEQPEVMIAALRFFDEFARNRSQRIQFDTSSPNGCLLFRDVSRVICLVGSKLERLDSAPATLTRTAIYALKLKASAICFTMLRAALAGNYANFGVMRYYGDRSFELAAQTAFKMALVVSSAELRDYPKLHSAYYALLECIAQDYVQCFARLDQQALGCILETVTSGIESVDTTACATCCNVLDSVLSHAYKTIQHHGKQRSLAPGSSGSQDQLLTVQSSSNGFDNPHDSLLSIVEKQPVVFEHCLALLLNVILNEESRNQYSLTRPLLVLILLFEKPFAQLRSQIIAGAPAEKQERLRRLFDKIMENVEPNLTTKNRDRFTQNVSACKQELAEPLRGEIGSVGHLTCDAEGDSDMW